MTEGITDQEAWEMVEYWILNGPLAETVPCHGCQPFQAEEVCRIFQIPSIDSPTVPCGGCPVTDTHDNEWKPSNSTHTVPCGGDIWDMTPPIGTDIWDGGGNVKEGD